MMTPARSLRLLAPLPQGALSDVSGRELADIEPVALRHNLLMLLYSQLLKHDRGEVGPSADFLARHRSLYYGNAARSMKQEAFEQRVLLLLGDGGIPVCLIKGNEIAREIFGDPNSRTSSDIDILIRAGDVADADRMLTSAGYDRAEEIPLRFWLTRLHHALYQGPDRDHYLELHWNFSVPAFFRLSSEEIWKEVSPDAGGRLRLSPEMTVIHMLIHHYMHVFRDLKIVVDVLWTLYRYDREIDWKGLGGMLGRIGLLKTTLITLSQIEALWPEQSSELISLKILKEEIEKRRVRVPRGLISFFAMDVGRKPSDTDFREQCAKRFVLDRWTTIWLSFLRVILPLPEAVRGFYGDDRKWMLPFNYMRFMAWRLKELFIRS